MIVKEIYKTRDDGTTLYRTFSDKGVKIRKVKTDEDGNRIVTDEIYDEAIDIEDAKHTFEETDIAIERGVE